MTWELFIFESLPRPVSRYRVCRLSVLNNPRPGTSERRAVLRPCECKTECFMNSGGENIRKSACAWRSQLTTFKRCKGRNASQENQKQNAPASPIGPCWQTPFTPRLPGRPFGPVALFIPSSCFWRLLISFWSDCERASLRKVVRS